MDISAVRARLRVSAPARGWNKSNGFEDSRTENGSSHCRNLALTGFLVPRLYPPLRLGEREIFYWQPTGPNPLNRRDDFSRPALHHRSMNSLFQVALYLPF